MATLRCTRQPCGLDTFKFQLGDVFKVPDGLVKAARMLVASKHAEWIDPPVDAQEAEIARLEAELAEAEGRKVPAIPRTLEQSAPDLASVAAGGPVRHEAVPCEHCGKTYVEHRKKPYRPNEKVPDVKCSGLRDKYQKKT